MKTLNCTASDLGFGLKGSPKEAHEIGPVFESYIFRERCEAVTSMVDDELDRRKIGVQILLDTGSPIDCVSEDLAQKLGLSIIRSEVEQGCVRNVYDVAVWLPDGSLYAPSNGFLGYGTEPHQILLGRLFLSVRRFICDIGAGKFEILK